MTRTIIENVTCLGCGCACDDIDVVVDERRILEARNVCALGSQWFESAYIPSRCLVNDRDASLTDAVSAAASALNDAERPLVYLAPDLSCESQRAAVAVADLLRARIDSSTSSAASAMLAAQERGLASATLGEIRNRADVVMFWGVDVEARYPRFVSRYAPPGSRSVVAVDVGDALASVDADHRIAIAPADELTTLTALEALCRTGPAIISASLGDPAAAELFNRLSTARYIGLVYDAEPDTRSTRSPQRFDALASLSQALNERTRCAAIGLRAGGNRPGADATLVSQTGYPFAVDFSRGYPRYDPHGGSVLRLLGNNEADLVLIVGDAMLIPDAAALGDFRCIAIGPGASEWLGRVVSIDTGRDGIHAGGTAVRMDDVPLPLRATLPHEPSTSAVLQALVSTIRERQLVAAPDTMPR